MESSLTSAQLAAFVRDGFVLCPGFFGAGDMAPVQEEMRAGLRQRPYALPGHRALISHPGLMGIMEQLCGPRFLFHHLNTYFQTEGAEGVAWHNDFEQVSLPMPRTHANIIVLIYPDGLKGEVGDLVVVPKTHRIMAEWSAFSFLGTAQLPGEVVVDDLPPGSIAICHTGLVHCRRPKPGRGPRYFCDVSYVARGPLWPATCQHDWHEQYQTCLQSERERGGAFEHLFDATQFFDYGTAKQRLDALGQTEMYEALLGSWMHGDASSTIAGSAVVSRYGSTP